MNSIYISFTEAKKILHLRSRSQASKLLHDNNIPSRRGPNGTQTFYSLTAVESLYQSTFRTCKRCGKVYSPLGRRIYREYCSVECGTAHLVKKKCAVCGNIFVDKSQHKNQDTCKTCRKKKAMMKNEDPYGVMVFDTYRGRKCPKCGKPVPTGKYVCDDCKTRGEYEW